MKAIISAPAEGRGIAALGSLSVGDSGWFFGAFLDGETVLSSDGFTRANEDGALEFPYVVPRFESEQDFRSQFRAVEERCPRADALTAEK